ncbi:MAG: helix-turn-helix domain-containing protein [Xanthomarina gelatinilytica]|uniref:helix-turn-helix domain-containing protein n=1 Tax=Xanthomarina gelatinilytica TaxID=1137281 RepID=UPI003A862FDC
MTAITTTQKLLSKNLKEIRKEKGLHQTTVAERSGVIASTYSRIETCQVSPNLSTLEKIAEAMEVPMERFFKQDTTAKKTLLEKLEMIENMEDYNRSVVEVMIDTVLEKDKLEKAQQVKMKKRLQELDNIRSKE